MKALQSALYATQTATSDTIDRLRDASDSAPGIYAHVATLRTANALLGVLRRMVAGKSVKEIHDAFGAPGDWGYDTPLGDALAKIYRGEVQP